MAERIQLHLNGCNFLILLSFLQIFFFRFYLVYIHTFFVVFFEKIEIKKSEKKTASSAGKTAMIE